MPNQDADALIFDLDGVITQTRSLHEDAWKELFNDFLEKREGQAAFRPDDYAAYVDGKPRLDGIQSFLTSRNIQIPPGDQDDSPGESTIYALGNKKNQLFREMVHKKGVEVYSGAVEKLRHWRKQGLKTAIVSSSKNCRMIIEQIGIADLFDVIVDGLVAAERGLKGKPDPDIFLEAARELGARPARSVIFEDAISGVQAGRSGFFGLVVGVARFNNRDDLLQHGADIAIAGFDDFELFEDKALMDWLRPSVPMIFGDDGGFFKLTRDKTPVFFLDYDGTLTPIVKNPEDAVLSDGMRNALAALGEKFKVAVVTGRDLDDVREFIQLEHLIYSGSHGFVTKGPEGLNMEHEKAVELISLFDKVEAELGRTLGDKVSGAFIDRKRYAIALHYRNVAEEEVPLVMDAADKMCEKYPELKKGKGKKVVELRPDIDWNKGKAVLWILQKLDLDHPEKILPIFIGDDVTDEDAFKALKGRGVGILVENQGQETAASFSLKDVYQVQRLFEFFLEEK